MKRLQTCGRIAALLGLLYAAYWAATGHQAQQLENTPAGDTTQAQFVQAYPNLDRAFRYLDFRPYEEDYSGESMHPGQFIARHMRRHMWIGFALLFLGIGLATLPAATPARRAVHDAALICLGVSLVLIAFFHPIVWFWNAR